MAQQREQEAKGEALAKSARRRLWAFGAAVAALAMVGTFLVMILLPDPPPDAIVWYQGRDAGVFGELIATGIDEAVAETGIEVAEYTDLDDSDQIRDLMERGAGMLVLDFTKVIASDEDPSQELADRHFVIIDCEAGSELDLAPNVSCIKLLNAEVGFVAGVAAALATKSGAVGYLGGADVPVLRDMEAGFHVGVAYVDPTIDVTSLYLSGLKGESFDFSGFSSATLAKLAGEYLYRSGHDVVFQAAGASGIGLFQAAADFSQESGTHVWAVGVDGDEYQTVGQSTSLMFPMPVADLSEEEYGVWYQERLDSWRAHILTSAMKLTSAGIKEALVSYHATGSPGSVALGLHNGGVSYSTSGGHLDRHVPAMDIAIQSVLDGEVQFEVDYESPVLLIEDLITLPTD